MLGPRPDVEATRVRRLLCSMVGLSLLACMCLLAPLTASAQEDPAAVIKKLAELDNAKDVEAEVAFFTPDAVIQEPGDGPGAAPKTYTGTDGVREWVKNETSNGGEDDRVTLGEITVQGETASAPFQVTTNDADLIKYGLEPVKGSVEVVAKDGKVAKLTITIDPDWEKKANAAFAQMQASQTPGAMTDTGTGATGPGKLPATGSDPVDWQLVALVGVLGLVGLGAGVWLRRRST
jgi:ketosteroid isomerase-like protein